MKFLIAENGNFYKANLHSYSTLSDGRFTPEQLKKMYSEKGYSILAYTDKETFVTHDELTDDSFLALNGAVLSFSDRLCGSSVTSPEYSLRKCSDMGLIAPKGVSELPILPYPVSCQIYCPETINAARKIFKDNGFFITHNNPTYNLEPHDDYMAYDAPDALEIVNFSSFRSGAADRNEHIFEDLLLADKPVLCIAADGNKNDPDLPDSFGAWTMIKAPDLSYDSVMTAIRSGSFYSSEGPEIKELYVKDNRIYIKTSEVTRIRIATDTRAKALREHVDGTPFTETSFALSREYKYIRIVITDKHGRQAFTNAYYMDDIMEDVADAQ